MKGFIHLIAILALWIAVNASPRGYKEQKDRVEDWPIGKEEITEYESKRGPSESSDNALLGETEVDKDPPVSERLVRTKLTAHVSEGKSKKRSLVSSRGPFHHAHGHGHSSHGFGSGARNPCEGKNCGDTCIVGGDMAGACDSAGQCSFNYKYLGCECELIEVRSSGSAAKDQHKKMGIYKKEKYLHNGKSVFKHQDRDDFLFKLSSKLWVVGPKVGKAFGGLLNGWCGSFDPPVVPLCNIGWKYHADNGGWKFDGNLKIKCKSLAPVDYQCKHKKCGDYCSPDGWMRSYQPAYCDSDGKCSYEYGSELRCE